MGRSSLLRLAALAAVGASSLLVRKKAPLEGTYTLYQYRGRFCASGGKGHTGEYGVLTLMLDQMTMMTTYSGDTICNKVTKDGGSYVVDSCPAQNGACPLTCSSCPEKFVKHFDLDTCYEGWLLSHGGPPEDCSGERKFCKNVDTIDAGLARWCNKWPEGEVEVEITGYGGHYDGSAEGGSGPTGPSGGGGGGPTPPAAKTTTAQPTKKGGPTPPAAKTTTAQPTKKGGPTAPPKKVKKKRKKKVKKTTTTTTTTEGKVSPEGDGDEWGDEWGDDAEEYEATGVLVALEARCGEKGQLLSSNVENVESCAALAEGAGAEAFSMGKGIHDGKCYAETLDVNDKLISKWDANRADPPCPAKGGWKKDKNYDFYYLAKEEETMFFMSGPMVTPRFNETTII